MTPFYMTTRGFYFHAVGFWCSGVWVWTVVGRQGRTMGRRILNEALRTIVNADKRGLATAQLQPISTVISSFLHIMKHRGYIKDFQVYDEHRVRKITVELQGRIKDCRALMYRQDVKAKDIEKYKVQQLPTRQWGYIVITTPSGVLDHEEAIRQNVGGQVLGYFY
ncbi:small ribosomal subunit protein uS8my-like [Malania oleifera]|uniref:small ribosomal subunit protein uS8my-like n=1 Tax=Malania oleifera TaxID=397392 RepID=UPI0025AE7994|nr:small ribosomal subunit protein uS8my-like [Malania oleifera]